MCLLVYILVVYVYLYNEIQPRIQGTEALAERGYKEVDHLQHKTATKQKGIKGKACQWNRRKTSPLTAACLVYIARQQQQPHIIQRERKYPRVYVIDSLAINRSGTWRRRGERNVSRIDDGGRWSIRTNQKSIPRRLYIPIKGEFCTSSYRLVNMCFYLPGAPPPQKKIKKSKIKKNKSFSQ